LNRPRFDAASFLAEDGVMPKRYPSDQRERAVRKVMDRPPAPPTHRHAGQTVQTFQPELTDLQQQVLDLLHIPASVYSPTDAN